MSKFILFYNSVCFFLCSIGTTIQRREQFLKKKRRNYQSFYCFYSVLQSELPSYILFYVYLRICLYSKRKKYYSLVKKKRKDGPRRKQEIDAISFVYPLFFCVFCLVFVVLFVLFFWCCAQIKSRKIHDTCIIRTTTRNYLNENPKKWKTGDLLNYCWCSVHNNKTRRQDYIEEERKKCETQIPKNPNKVFFCFFCIIFVLVLESTLYHTYVLLFRSYFFFL